MLVVLVLLRRKKHRPSIAVASGWLFILRFTFMLAVTVFIAGVKTLTGSRV